MFGQIIVRIATEDEFCIFRQVKIAVTAKNNDTCQPLPLGHDDMTTSGVRTCFHSPFDCLTVGTDDTSRIDSRFIAAFRHRTCAIITNLEIAVGEDGHHYTRHMIRRLISKDRLVSDALPNDFVLFAGDNKKCERKKESKKIFHIIGDLIEKNNKILRQR